MTGETISAAIRAKACELGVKGVGGWTVLTPNSFYDETNYASYVVVDRFIRHADPADPEDTGTNYMGVAFTKMAQMVRTFHDSGMGEYEFAMHGEFDYRGGKFCTFGSDEDTNVFLVFFSGGTEDQDCVIAQAGLDAALEE